MICALLAGTKTQTRRIVKPQPIGVWGQGAIRSHTFVGVVSGPHDHCWTCPYGAPGDRLWVRETHALENRYRNVWCQYAADGHRAAVPAPELVTIARPGMRPSIHMPRWASRITLEITGVRVERLQNISEADAQAEGATFRRIGTGDARTGMRDCWSFEQHEGETARDAYRLLWEHINGDGSWDANPFVWVLTFRRIES